ncbi:hypothetical protein [Bacillus cereus group sp. TH160LC]|uniref:hypothetical protein n=1 Tax=Bacillus cereus group sp. TH160LC TaxID=3018058 RepID=UPI0022E06951|nr:hypothetical protein [Bacillus cereus group sp. TH160LC]MDA1652706.1 hypothetical protein [Bacillus cereus group sp. TH160LC]
MNSNCCNNKESKCICGGSANYSSAATRISVKICPRCNKRDSSAFIETLNRLYFKAVSFGFPSCFSSEDGLIRSLLVDGKGVLVVDGKMYDGLFTLSLIERPGEFDSVLLIFYDYTNTTQPARFAGLFAVPDANLVIRNCQTNICSGKRVGPFVQNNLSEFEGDLPNKIIVFNDDGTIEEVKL